MRQIGELLTYGSHCHDHFFSEWFYLLLRLLLIDYIIINSNYSRYVRHSSIWLVSLRTCRDSTCHLLAQIAGSIVVDHCRWMARVILQLPSANNDVISSSGISILSRSFIIAWHEWHRTTRVLLDTDEFDVSNLFYIRTWFFYAYKHLAHISLFGVNWYVRDQYIREFGKLG